MDFYYLIQIKIEIETAYINITVVILSKNATSTFTDRFGRGTASHFHQSSQPVNNNTEQTELNCFQCSDAVRQISGIGSGL